MAKASAATLREQSLLQLARNVSKQRAEEMPVVPGESREAVAAADGTTPPRAPNAATRRGEVSLGKRATPSLLRAALTSSAATAARGAIATEAKSNASANAPVNSSTWTPQSSVRRSVVAAPFDDFGDLGAPQGSADLMYDRVGLLADLHIPGTGLDDLRAEASHGSPTDFLGRLHVALCVASNASKRRLRILGIHERYHQSDRANASVDKLDSEVLVSLHFSPQPEREDGSSAEQSLSPSRIFGVLRSDLDADGQSSVLRQSLVGDTLQHAYLTLVSTPVRPGLVDDVSDEQASLSAMALPIGISAAFTGVLVWLAAW